MNRSETECQPCRNFVPGEPRELNFHQCIKCITGVVRFCGNCKRDHHIGGYNSCKYEMCPYGHPACLEKLEQHQ
jgi:hypothetical protein